MVQAVAPSRKEPRISVKPLSDYLLAGAAARKGIVKRQKHKPGWSGRYQAAYEAAQKLMTGRADSEALLDFADKLRNKPTFEDLEAERNELNADAIEHLVEAASDLPLDGAAIEVGPNDPEKMLIAGVLVSVRPEFILRTTDKQGNAVIGALKLCFTKTEALGKERGAYVATAIHQYVESKLITHMAGLHLPSRELCLVLDVFSGEIYEAPKAVKKRRADIVSACEEIAMRWESVG